VRETAVAVAERRAWRRTAISPKKWPTPRLMCHREARHRFEYHGRDVDQHQHDEQTARELHGTVTGRLVLKDLVGAAAPDRQARAGLHGDQRSGRCKIITASATALPSALPSPIHHLEPASSPDATRPWQNR
jgi:hypothetical protein